LDNLTFNQRAPSAQKGKQWVVSDKTHCEPIDLLMHEQWVLAHAL